MIVAINTSIAVPILVTDATGSGATGLTVTATARLAGSGATAATAATERGSGAYDVDFTPTAVGNWQVISTATVDGITGPVDVTVVDVVTAAQFDPAAHSGTMRMGWRRE